MERARSRKGVDPVDLDRQPTRPEGPAGPFAEDRSGPAIGDRLSSADVVRLQRLIGNTAVAAMLARRAATRPPPRRPEPTVPRLAGVLPTVSVPDRAAVAPDAVPSMARQGGGRNVSTALDAPVIFSLQRDDPKDPPPDYTQKKGVQNVRGSGMTRVEVRGLTMGLAKDFDASYTRTRKDGKQITEKSFEKEKTAEHPQHMAVVVMPDHIPEGAVLQVILHFHGLGYRSYDPYAGYLEKRDANVAERTVRDVAQEHWEQQLGAVNSARTKGQPLVVAILAQGRGQEDFGNTETYAFVNDVLTHVPALSKIIDYEIVLSAHSGGGFRIADRIDQVKTADKARLSAAKPGRLPERATDLVVMFDAEAITSVAEAARAKITALAKTLKDADPTTARAAIAATPKFRFYFFLNGHYHNNYVAQWKKVQTALTTVPTAWRQGGSEVMVDDLVRFVAVFGEGVDHEHVISGGKPAVQTAETEKEGSLADALRASLDPMSDRDKAFDESKLTDNRKPAADAKAAKGATKAAKKGAAATPRRGSGRTRRRSDSATTGGASTPVTPPTVPATPARPTTSPGSTTKTPTPSTAPVGWRTAGMVADYTYTDKHKQVIASQSKEERAADRIAFDKNAKKKLSALTKKEKKGTITDAEKAELAELRALSGRVAVAESALKHKDVEEVLAAARTNVAAWYGVLQTGKFLNQSVHVHPALAARLARAESALLADPKVNPTKLDAAGLGKKLVYSVADMRIPKSATGGTSLSMHVFGLAVDLNYKGNPFVGHASTGVFGVAMRATSLVNGTAVDIRPKLGKAGAAYDILSAVSRAISTYLSFTGADDTTLAELVRNHTPLKGEPTDLAGWVKQIEKDRKSVAGGDFAGHTAAAEGFMDLDKALVLAMADAGLTWGGTYGGGKDIMHFDLREGEGAAIERARNAHTAST
jgi:hypothetical protein